MEPLALIVDDEAAIRRTVSLLLREDGFQTLEADNVEDALACIRRHEVHVVLLDLRLGQSDGMDLLRQLGDLSPAPECLVMTAYGTISNAVESMRLGAFDYLTKPVDPDELLLRVSRAAERVALSAEVTRLRQELADPETIVDFRAESPAMRSIAQVVRRVAKRNIPILIRGETGTGKDVVARAIHAHSVRSKKRFLPVNCCTLPENLMESELFGHVKGAFTSATSNAQGLFRQADGGTLFLDEIGDISLSLQAKLLRVLEDGMVRPVGGDQQIPVDVRIIAATNRDLEKAVSEGKFREDLFFRLNVLQIEIPPLRERIEDVQPLIDMFLERIRRRRKTDAVRMTAAARRYLETEQWPGNARELQNRIERACALSESDVIDVADVTIGTPCAIGNDVEDSDARSLEQVVDDHIRSVLAEHHGNQVAAAAALGISRSTLRRRLHRN